MALNLQGERSGLHATALALTVILLLAATYMRMISRVIHRHCGTRRLAADYRYQCPTGGPRG
jgi:hypothetical protein